jgi:hypothetical protein
MRVYHAEAVARLHVLDDHFFEKSRFACARLADAVEVAQSVILRESGFGRRIAVLVYA